MPQFDGPGREQEHSMYKAVAASQTTAQISTSGDGAVGDYIHRLIIVPASSAVGAVTLLDGSTAVLSIPALAGGDSKPYGVECGMVCTSTKGWVVTTGSSVAIVAVGRFNR